MVAGPINEEEENCHLKKTYLLHNKVSALICLLSHAKQQY